MMSGTQFTVVSGAPQGAANSGQNSTNPGMLNGSRQSRGMLAAGNTQTSQSHENSGTLLGNRQALPVQGGGVQNPGSKVALNPQPSPPGPAGHAGARRGTLAGNGRVAAVLSSP